MSRRFVDMRVIHQRMLRKDLRMQAEARRRSARVQPVVDVAIIPVSETAGVVDIALGQALDEQDDRDEDYGSNCGAGCGFCGRCS